MARAAGKMEPATEYMTMFQQPSKMPKQTRQKAAPMKLAEVVTQAVMQPRRPCRRSACACGRSGGEVAGRDIDECLAERENGADCPELHGCQRK